MNNSTTSSELKVSAIVANPTSTPSATPITASTSVTPAIKKENSLSSNVIYTIAISVSIALAVLIIWKRHRH